MVVRRVEGGGCRHTPPPPTINSARGPQKEPPRQPLLVNQRPDTSFPSHQEVGSTTQVNKRPKRVFSGSHWVSETRVTQVNQSRQRPDTSFHCKQGKKIQQCGFYYQKIFQKKSECLNFALMQFMVWDSSVTQAKPPYQTKA